MRPEWDSGRSPVRWAAAFSVIAIAGIGGRITSVKLILAGVALSSLCSAFSNLIVYVADDPSRFMTVQFWLMGSLAGAQWSGNFRIMCVVLPCTLFFISRADTEPDAHGG